MRGLPMAAMGVAVAALLAGCEEKAKELTPKAEAANEVVFKVPSMT